MPVYEYECTRCGHIEEAFQHFSDRPLSKCPNCSGKLQKLISQSSFHLKGTGWYVTDYANRNKNSRSTPKQKDEPKSDKSDTSSKTTQKTEE
jgi:putative FmdB family regulatory protein